jgi:hypothetical protein
LDGKKDGHAKNWTGKLDGLIVESVRELRARRRELCPHATMRSVAFKITGGHKFPAI